MDVKNTSKCHGDKGEHSHNHAVRLNKKHSQHRDNEGDVPTNLRKMQWNVITVEGTLQRS